MVRRPLESLLTPSTALLIADLDPTDEAIFAYLLACAITCIYDGGTMALSARWSRDPQTVASLRRRSSQEAGQIILDTSSRPGELCVVIGCSFSMVWKLF